MRVSSCPPRTASGSPRIRKASTWFCTTSSVTGCEVELRQRSGRRAVFFDRDGVLNPPYAYPEWGLDSPARPEHLSLYPDAAQAIRSVRSAGFLAVLVSNQPGIAKGKYSLNAFDAIDG